MRGLQSRAASLFVITESCIREELSFLNLARKFTASTICNASNKGDEGGRKGRTQELLEALTPSEAKVTASESELEEASKRHAVCGVHLYLHDICNEWNGNPCAERKIIAGKR